MITVDKNKSRQFIIERTTWTPPDKDNSVEFIKIQEQTKNQNDQWVFMKGHIITLPIDEEVINNFCDAIKKEFDSHIDDEDIPF